MLFKSLFFLLLLIKGMRMLGTDCFTHLISMTDPKTYTCSLSGKFTKADGLELSNPSRQLAVAMSIRGTDKCGNSAGTFNLLTVSILVSGARRTVLAISYDIGTNQLAFFCQDESGSRNFHSASAPGFYVPYNIFITLNMDSGTASAGGIIDNADPGNTLSSLTYGIGWAFDDTTEIVVCSDSGSIGCNVSYLKVGYSSSFFGSPIDFAMKATYKADYRLNDGSGNTLTNSLGTLGPAIMSNPAPSWVPGGGIKFTTEAQYLTPPAFIPAASDPTIVTSCAVNLYIKIEAPPSADANLFSYISNKPGLNDYVFRLTLMPTMFLKIQIDTVSYSITTAVQLGEWTQIYASYIYTFGGLGIAVVYINGDLTIGGAVKTSVYGPSVFTTSDQIRIGEGVIAELKRVQIFSPATLYLHQGICLTSSCDVDPDFWVFPTCLVNPCTKPGSYPSFGYCKKCPTECATCSDATTCESCIPGYYHLPTNICEKCPTGCVTCSDANTCGSCIPGYYHDGTTCKKCLTHCKTCINSQTCQTCNSGYGMMNNICILCPVGTYLSPDQFCKEISQALQDTLTDSQLAATQVTNLISKGSSVSLSAMVGGKIFSQIKYLNISYSGELQVALLTWLPSFLSLGLTPDMPESLIDEFPVQHVPYVFEKYETNSSFLVNFWENLGIVFFVSALWLLFKGIEHLISRGQNPRVASLIRKARIMIQNFLLSALYGVHGDLVLFSIIEYRSLAFGWNLSLLSFIISLSLLLTMFLIFFYQIKLLRAYQRIKRSTGSLEEFTKTHEGSQMFWKDFKDSSIGSQLFPLFLSGRDIIFSFMLATMFEYPLAQSILVIILDCLMIAYLFIKRPFESTFDLIQQLFFELVGLGVMIAVFINAIFDAGKYQTFQGRINAGKFIIVANMIFNFVAVVFMLIIIGQSLLEFYKSQKEKRVKKLRSFNCQSRLENVHHLDSSQAKFTQENSVSNNTSQNLEILSSQQENFDSNLLRNSRNKSKCQRLFNPTKQSPDLSSLTNEESLHMNDKNFQESNVNNRQPSKNSSNARPQRGQGHQQIQDQGMSEITRQPKIKSRLPPSAHPRR